MEQPLDLSLADYLIRNGFVSRPRTINPSRAALRGRSAVGQPESHECAHNTKFDSWTALGRQPEHMTGCTGCFDYVTTEGQVNDIVVDPTNTTNGSIVAYLGNVGGGGRKTTNCCTSSTSWSVTTDDPLLSTISIESVTIDPSNHNTIQVRHGLAINCVKTVSSTIILATALVPASAALLFQVNHESTGLRSPWRPTATQARTGTKDALVVGRLCESVD